MAIKGNTYSAIVKEYADIASQDIVDEIDFSITVRMLIDFGWSTAWARWPADEAEVEAWVQQHIKGKHKHRGTKWIFEKPADATWFRLAWPQ